MRLAAAFRLFEHNRRFWRLVDVDGPQGCWRWKGELDADGEPIYEGRPASLHAYELARGPLPAATRIDRRCGHDRCVNPDHLQPIQAPGD